MLSGILGVGVPGRQNQFSYQTEAGLSTMLFLDQVCGAAGCGQRNRNFRRSACAAHSGSGLMAPAIVYWGYIGIMEKKMETTICL